MDWDLNQRDRRGPPISIAILGPWELRHKETPTILVELPLASRLLWALCLCTVVFFQLPTSPPTKHLDRDPTIHTIHASTRTDLSLMPLTLPLTKAPARCRGASHSQVSTRAYCADASDGRHATPLAAGGMLDQLSQSRPIHLIPTRPLLLATRISLHHTCRLIQTDVMAKRHEKEKMEI